MTNEFNIISKLGRRWEEWGETKVLDWETEKIRDGMEKGLKKGIEQELQEDWSRIDNSTNFPTYKRIKEGIGRESYFGWKMRRRTIEKFGPEQNGAI